MTTEEPRTQGAFGRPSRSISPSPLASPAVRDDAPRRDGPLPATSRKRANRLLDQQFWLWGCDIRRADGNLLSLLGFRKIASPPASGVKISRYAGILTPTRRILLWGFGLCLEDDALGSIFIPRSGFAPRYAPDVPDMATAWKPGWFDQRFDLAASKGAPNRNRLVLQAIDWIVWYEQRVLELAGTQYRQQALGGWSRAVCPCDEIAGAWRQVRLDVRRSYGDFTAHGDET